MAVTSCSSKKILSFSTCSSFDCRSDPDFSCSARFEKPGISSARFIGAPTASFSGVSPLIFMFPPNFVRQLSTKARRNCCNIGVAQIVAASWSNGAGSGSKSTSAAAASAVLAPPAAVEIATVDTVAVVGGLNNVQPEALADLKNEASFLSSDGSLAIHAGERLGRGIVTDALTTPVVNTSAYFFKKTAELIDFKEKRHSSFEYGRYGNPTTLVAEEKISALEGVLNPL